MLDSRHLFRSGGTNTEVAAAVERIIGLQLNDAPEAERDARVFQAQQRRLLPGDGAIGVAELVRVLRDGGCTAPVGVEVTSVDLEALPGVDVVERAAAALRTVLDQSIRR
jgi:sugar phosphate isomerase/epimerase